MKITQETDYPWNGSVKVLVEPEQPSTFSLFLRIPGWSVGSRVKVDGRMLAPRGPYYLEVRKRWHSPSVVKITLLFRHYLSGLDSVQIRL